MRDYIVLIINKQRHEIPGSQAFLMLADYLRSIKGLCGTKVVCAEGDCGACTVLCYRPELQASADFMPINACIALVAQLDGAHIITVEGLKVDNQLSQVQEAAVKAHASQCGFCTPGFVMAITSLCEKNRKSLTEQDIKNNLTGNLCRCTGYQTIIKAAQDIKIGSVSLNNFLGQETHDLGSVCVTHNSQVFFAPTDLTQAKDWLKSNAPAQIFGSATDLGVGINKGKISLSRALSLHHIKELYAIEHKDQIIHVGARVLLSELRDFLQCLVPEFARFLNIFASPQIKNMATLIGNVANASPIADTPPFLMVSDAQIHMLSHRGSREVYINNFYIGYKSLDLAPDEIITHISFKLPTKSDFLRLYKISQRRDLDISTVNAAFCCDLDSSQEKPVIGKARIALGGVAERVVRAVKTESFLTNKILSEKIIDEASKIIQLEINPLDDLRGSKSYRRVLIDTIMRRYFQEIMDNHHA